MTRETPPEKTRVVLELAKPAATELDRLQQATELSRVELFRHALSLLRLYVNAKGQGKRVLIVSESNSDDVVSIEMPIHIQADQHIQPPKATQ